MNDHPVSLVTGASRGIGSAIVQSLAALGHAVLVNYRQDQKSAAAVVAEIVKAGGHAVAVQGDVGCGDDRQRLIAEALNRFGRLDVLVNNAGITSPGRLDLLEATEASWDTVFATNLKGPFFLSQQAALAMRQQIRDEKITGGKIINISSLSSYTVSTDRADYCLTKAAMGMMTKLFGWRLAEEKIQVFELCPGIIDSDMTSPVKEKYDRLISAGLMPIRRWGNPEDVAKAVVAIVSECFPFSTGERINIDGGFHIRSI